MRFAREVKPLKKHHPIENKVMKLLSGENEETIKIVTGWDEVFQLFRQGWDLLEVMDEDRILMKKNDNKKNNSLSARVSTIL